MMIQRVGVAPAPLCDLDRPFRRIDDVHSNRETDLRQRLKMTGANASRANDHDVDGCTPSLCGF